MSSKHHNFISTAPRLTMPFLEEVASEDLGFKLINSLDGIPIFDQGIDLDSVANDSLNLLVVGNVSKIFACSNGSSIVLDRLSALDTPEISPSKISLNNSGITQLALNADESKLLIVNNYKLQYIDVPNYLSSGSEVVLSFPDFFEVGDITTVLPNPVLPESLLITTSSKQLHSIINSQLSLVDSNVTCASWSLDGSSYYYTSSSSLDIQSSTKSVKITKEILDDEEFQPGEYHSLYVQELAPSTKWIVAYESNESELDNHEIKSYVISRDQNEQVSAEVTDLAPPYGSVPRVATYYTAPLVNWVPETTLHFITSSIATDLGTIILKDKSSASSIIQSEDTDRAQFPIDDDTGDDASPIGVAIDVSNVDTVVSQPCTGVEEAQGLPRLLALLHTGRLVSWWVFDKRGLQNNSVNLSRSLEFYTKKSLRPPPSAVPDITDSYSLDDLSLGSSSRDATPSNSSDIFKKESPPNLFGNPSSLNENPFGKTDPFMKKETPFGSSSTTTNSDNPFGKSSQSAFQTSASAQNKSTESTTSKESAPFGSSTLSSAPVGFGKAGMTPNTSLSAGFGNNNLGSSSLVGGFGSVGFANAGSSNPGFGSSSFGNTSFGKSSFGTASFGSGAAQGLSLTSGKPSGFANIASKPSGFAMAANNANGFSALGDGSSKDSPFGSKPTPFGSKTESPFGSSKDSPFGAKPTQTGSKTDSPFGSNTKASTMESNKDSPFGSKPSLFASKTESPFGAKPLFGSSTNAKSDLNTKPVPSESSKDSPFGAKPFGSNTESPFGAKPFGTSTESPFGAKPFGTSTESPFGAKPFGTSTGSPFGTSTKDSPFGSSKETNEIPSISSDDKPLFGSTVPRSDSQFGESKPKASIFNKPAESNSIFSGKTSAFGEDTIKLPSAIGGSELFKNVNEKPSVFANLNQKHEEEEEDQEEEEVQALSDSEEEFEDESEDVTENSYDEQSNDGYDVISEPESRTAESKSSDPSHFDNVIEAQVNRIEKNQENINRNPDEEPKRISDEEFVIIENAEVEGSEDNIIGNAKKDISEPVIPDHIERQKSLSSSDNSALEVELIQKNIPPTKSEFLQFDGLLPGKQTNSNPIIHKMELIQLETDGQLEILHRNLKELEKTTNYQDSPSKIDHFISKEVLKYPKHWKFSDIPDMITMKDIYETKITALLKEARGQDNLLQDLILKFEHTHGQRIQIEKLFSQISDYTKTQESAILKRRPLDLQNSTLQTSLRSKLQRVKDLEKELVTKMMPLKARLVLDSKSITSLERVLFNLDSQLRDHLDHISELTEEVNKLDIQETEPKDDLQMIDHTKSNSKLNIGKSFKKTPLRKNIVL